MEKNIALCLFCKDENEFLKEWIEYHLSLNVDHIFIFDNKSKKPLKDELKNINHKNKVTIESFDQTTINKQNRCYNQVIKDKKEFKWIGFIDTDEFVVLLKHKNLFDKINQYQNYAALGVFWRVFGSNGHISKQSSQILSYTKRTKLTSERNQRIKSFIQPKLADSAINPHFFLLKNGEICVDENKNQLLSQIGTHTSKEIWINHYVLRSREDFQNKIKRGGGNGLIKKWKYFEDIDAEVTENDFTLKNQTTLFL